MLDGRWQCTACCGMDDDVLRADGTDACRRRCTLPWMLDYTCHTSHACHSSSSGASVTVTSHLSLTHRQTADRSFPGSAPVPDELMRIARTRRLTKALQTANAMNQIYICTQHGARVLQERRGVDACAFPSAYARIQLGSLIDMMPGIQATVPPTGTCCSKLLTTCI